METPEICILCDNPAQVEKGDGGNRYVFNCSGSCPTFEITRKAQKELEDNPGRKRIIIEKIKAFNKENADDMPLIRINPVGLMEVTTRSRER